MINPPVNQQIPITNPQYYEEKASQLRLQNQILKRQLQSNVRNPGNKRSYSPQQNYFQTNQPRHYSFQKDGSNRQVIYRTIGQPIRQYINQGPANVKNINFQTYPDRARTQRLSAMSARDLRYETDHVGSYTEWQRRNYMTQVQEQIIQLQTRGYKLQRQANKLSSYIKQDLRDFVRDSNIHQECSYKQKYLRAISNRPRYFRFNM